MKWIGLWLMRGLIAVAALSLAAYAADWTVYKMRSSPQSTVNVSRFMGIPLKGAKTEYDYLGSSDVACAVALLPHGGQKPCWYLQRNPNQWDNVGSPAY